MQRLWDGNNKGARAAGARGDELEHSAEDRSLRACQLGPEFVMRSLWVHLSLPEDSRRFTGGDGKWRRTPKRESCDFGSSCSLAPDQLSDFHFSMLYLPC